MRTKKTSDKQKNSNNIHSALDRFYTAHIEELEQEKININKKKQQLKKKQVEFKTETQYYIRNRLDTEINDIEKEIEYIESGDKLTDYIMKVCHIVCEYSDLNTKVEMSSENELATLIDRKHVLVQEYCNIMKLEYNNIPSNSISNKCTNCETIITDTVEGFLVCIECGSTKKTIEVHSTPSFKEARTQL
jgi:hypothetical protein